MWRTSIVVILSAIASFAVARWITHDFQVWTAEGARRLEVALHPVPAPRVSMEGPGLRGQTLDRLLSGEGAVTLVDFMYTRCVTVCAVLGGTFQQAQASIVAGERKPGEAPLRLLSISFDPERDDVGVLRAYAAGLRADPVLWRFARVSSPVDAQRVLDTYRVTVIDDGLGGYEHNAALLVVDPMGRLVRVFDSAELGTALNFSRALAAAGTSP